jgi:hypothetical protein
MPDCDGFWNAWKSIVACHGYRGAQALLNVPASQGETYDA